MADVRALLRNERLARRITHPNAVYSSAGTLSCNVCNLRLQADSLWEPHLAGKTHRKNVQLLQTTPLAASATERSESASTTAINPVASNGNGHKRKADDAEDLHRPTNGKKRKAADSEDENETRQHEAPEKRQKHNEITAPDGFKSTKTKSVTFAEPNDEDQNDNPMVAPIVETVVTDPPDVTDTAVNDDEYAAFEAAIAANAMEDESIQQPAISALRSNADIAAAPITAAELASKQADELNQQRRGRDAEIEDEKEDATRALEEEFDEMDQLEARVRKLREMRERLRQTQQQEDSDEEAEDVVIAEAPAPQNHINDDDDNTDDDYDDDWGYR